MPFFVINKIPVFLTWDRDKELREEIFGIENVFGSYIQRYGQKNNDYKKIKKALYKKYLQNKMAFVKEWSEFDLYGEDAASNMWDLIYDYCAYYGCGYTSDIRDETSFFVDDSMGQSFLFPQGRTFMLNYYVAPYNWRWKYIRRKKGITITTVIDATNVERIVGTLANFTIFYKDRIIKCGEVFDITLIH
ncbi:hypothetical protein D3C74_288380 [compost metagenome]